MQEPELDEAGNEIVTEVPAEPIVLTKPNDPNDWEFWREKCYVRVKQFRQVEEAVVEEAPKDKKAIAAAQAKAAEEAKKAAEKAAAEEAGLPEEEPPFEIEKIPAKAPIVAALNNELGMNFMLHHTGK